MTNVLLMFVLLLVLAAASCPRNDLQAGKRNETAGDELLFSRCIETHIYNHICWRGYHQISLVEVYDLIMGGMPATPRIFSGGPKHSFVCIKFEKEHGLQFINVRIAIWGFRPARNQIMIVDTPLDEDEGLTRTSVFEGINARTGGQGTLYMARVSNA